MNISSLLQRSCFRTSPIRIRASASNNSDVMDGAIGAVSGEQVEEERRKIVSGYVLEDVSHFSNYIPDLSVCALGLRRWAERSDLDMRGRHERGRTPDGKGVVIPYEN
ncbi:hypothetical protein AKJ16_DCAP20610 [Drosera capensis]